ncbi:DUF6777 domain-containing protein [Gordonia liuliyuniae]|uniref:DUF6777 domain-containing protein n=1 Tax=Gordonia liuliyuniae TaxID=2911517 RepID=A0ABS9INV3_9ACTN|nr:DUF6777 domain-containing protein [Gordonia liuliyuniae]MCF8587228.1 hypothetical protein [Gordonia liuliyuniae]
MTYPYGPDPATPYGPDPATTALHTARRRSRRRLTIVLSAIVAILAVVVGLGAVKLYQDETGDILIPALSLRAADDPGPDPFTRSVALTNRLDLPAIAPHGVDDRGVRAVDGTAPGLYGTTGAAACDTAALADLLAGDPAAGTAWAGVFGIRRIDIPWYLNTLTPVLLTADTWVTNHAYRSGVAQPFQSVLQAGTAVYVDGAGVPRAVCTCGNPLVPPASAPVGDYRVVGQPWPSYRTTNIERVSYTVHNTTVNNPGANNPGANNPGVVNTPAPLTQLTVLDVVRGVNVVTEIGNTLTDLGPAPAGMKLPDPIAANGPSVAGTSATPEAGTSEATGAGESSAAQAQTDFGSSTGDAIGALTFTSDGQGITCTLPSTFDSGEVAADCTDGSTRTFATADLLFDAVTTAVNASSDRVWTVATTDGQTLTVTSAAWQTLVPATETTATTETPDTAESPETAESPVETEAPTTTESATTTEMEPTSTVETEPSA